MTGKKIKLSPGGTETYDLVVSLENLQIGQLFFHPSNGRRFLTATISGTGYLFHFGRRRKLEFLQINTGYIVSLSFQMLPRTL